MGFEWHTTINNKSDIQAIYHCINIEFKENIVDLLDYMDDERDYIIEYTSFELGKEVNAEWVFDGDNIKYKIIGEDDIIHTGELGFYGDSFAVVEDSYSGAIRWYDIEFIEVASNIHEEGK